MMAKREAMVEQLVALTPEEQIRRLGWRSSWGAPPRWATRRNPARATHGPAVAEISALLGKPMFPSQRYVVDVALEVDPETGGPWYETVIVLEPRRSGKTVLIPPLAARACGQKTGAQVWFTAQKRDNAVQRWREATDPLMSPVQLVDAKRKVGQGFEELRWSDNSLFRPFAPDEESMHGADPDLVFVDELWSLGLAEFEVIREGYSAAWSVKPGQEWLLSAAGTAKSGALKKHRRQGRAATFSPSSRIACFEWCIEEEPGGVPAEKLSDEQLLAEIMAAHPRAGFGLRPDFVAGEIRANKIAAIRAYGGLDRDVSEGADTVIPGTALRRSEDRTPIPTEARVAIGLATDRDARQAALSVAWEAPDGRVWTELIQVGDGVRWAVWQALDVLGRWEGSSLAVRSDPGGRDLGDEVAREMAALQLDVSRLMRVSQSDYAAACHRFRSGLQAPAPRVLHRGESGFLGALRNAGEARGVWVAEKGPIAALDSHTLAAWASSRLPAEPAPPRKFFVY